MTKEGDHISPNLTMGQKEKADVISELMRFSERRYDTRREIGMKFTWGVWGTIAVFLYQTERIAAPDVLFYISFIIIFIMMVVFQCAIFTASFRDTDTAFHYRNELVRLLNNDAYAFKPDCEDFKIPNNLAPTEQFYKQDRKLKDFIQFGKYLLTNWSFIFHNAFTAIVLVFALIVLLQKNHAYQVYTSSPRHSQTTIINEAKSTELISSSANTYSQKPTPHDINHASNKLNGDRH